MITIAELAAIARRARAGTTMPLPVLGIALSTLAGFLVVVVVSPSSKDVVAETVVEAFLSVVVSLTVVDAAVVDAPVVVGAAVVVAFVVVVVLPIGSLGLSGSVVVAFVVVVVVAFVVVVVAAVVVVVVTVVLVVSPSAGFAKAVMEQSEAIASISASASAIVFFISFTILFKIYVCF